MSREKVYEALRERPGQFLSGEELSRRLGISRAAVWKAVDTLRREGYTIEARTGLGYALTAVPDALTLREIRRWLPREPENLLCLDQVDSTNSYLKRAALEGAPHGMAVVANQQTGGRGRMGRQFQSPRDKGVFLSVLLRPALSPEGLLPVTAMSAVAVCNTVERVCGVRPGIKWTNDVVLNGKKLCGILTEVALEGETGQIQSLIIGVGVNVHHTPQDFTPEVAAIATSLDQELGGPVSRPQVAAALYQELLALGQRLGGDLSADLAAYRRDCLTLGREVRLLWGDSRERVTALDVDDQFGLVVRRADGTVETIRSGEVSVRGLFGYVE